MIKELAKQLKYKSPDLITRPIGRDMYSLIIKKIKNVNEGETIIIDFEEIKVIDSSFIDECLIKLLIDSVDSEKPFYIKFKNITNVAEANIAAIIGSYSIYAKKRLVLITDEIRSNNSFFIGELQLEEKDLFDYVRINSIVSLEDLEQFTKKDSKEILPLIEKLFSLRIIRKIDRFTYSKV